MDKLEQIIEDTTKSQLYDVVVSIAGVEWNDDDQPYAVSSVWRFDVPTEKYHEFIAAMKSIAIEHERLTASLEGD